MRRTITSSSTLREVPIAKSEATPVAPPPEKKKEAVKRTAAPKAPNSMSLDDLFGISSPNDKPIRLRSNHKKKSDS